MKMPNTCKAVTMRFVYHLATTSACSPSECRTTVLTIQMERMATTVGLWMLRTCTTPPSVRVQHSTSEALALIGDPSEKRRVS